MRKALIAAGVIFLFLVATSIQSPAEENLIYACLDKNGKVRFASDPSECKEKETAIYWNKVGPQGPPGSGCLKVYDSSEPPQYLGVLLQLTSFIRFQGYKGITIFVPSLGKAVIINREDGYLITSPWLYFEDELCQGTPYLGDGYDEYQDAIFMYGDTSCPENMRFFTLSHSRIWFVAPMMIIRGCNGCEPLGGGTAGYGYEAIEIPKEDIPFTLPVTFPLTYECQDK